MDFADLVVFIRVVLKEIWAHKVSILFSAAIIGFAVLFIGISWPVTYETSTTFYADNQNILKPLLDKQAAVSKVEDQVRIVRDVMLSPRLLSQVMEKIYVNDEYKTPVEQERRAKEIRENLDISMLGKNYIKVTYSGHSPDGVYDTLNALTDLFIRDSAESKRTESKEAYQFIDNQVKQYKSQLVVAEERLKKFQSANLDGSDVDVGERIATLRDTIENLKLSLGEVRTRIQSLNQQLQEENSFSAKKFKADVYRERLAELLAKRDSLLLTFKESHPDVVSVGLQIQDMQNAIREAEKEHTSGAATSGETTVNPLYQELRSKLADAKVELYTGQRRLLSTEKLLEQEYARRKRIAEREAELLELKRDYDVTKKIYEEMLERREKARLSMTLNLEGQGITYKIQEPSQYPLAPKGLRFIHFVIVGLLLGIAAPIGIIVLYVIIDPRIRFVSQVENIISMPLLAVVPHTITPISKRIMKVDMLLIIMLGTALVAAYVGVAYSHYVGII
ncbi:MAG: chain length-determining protein [Exilibacterium sp.]